MITQREAARSIGAEAIAKVEPIKYVLYARKSSEADERQALSIESQIKEMLTQTKRDSLNIVEVRRESHSAKDSGQRPVFNELLEDIRGGTFDGIISWAPDRLSRNAGDLGSLVDLIDQGTLREIRTHGQRFTNSPNDKFLLMILGSQAKLENDSKGENVKRGLRAKCQMGWRPGMSPIGYLNDYGTKGQRKIYLDPDRAPVIKEMFEKVAQLGWTGRMLYEWLIGIDFKSRAGKRFPLSCIYLVLKNAYYCGTFEYPVGSGQWFTGGHPALITNELFDKVQEQLTVAPKARPGTKEFNFVRIVTCGSCGAGITAEEKFKRLKDGTIKRYVYYHCTKSINRDCAEPYIREDELLDQLLQLIDRVNIDKIATNKRIREEVERYGKFMRGVLHKEPQTDIPKVDLKNYAKYILTDGTKEEKRELLSHITTHLYLKDQKVLLDIKKSSKS